MENVAIEVTFNEIYKKFKLHFYQKIFSRFETREATLTTTETFCIETIAALGTPSISEFAHFLHISQANAAYKVQNLIKKGYLEKKQSERDHREYFLTVTEKFTQYNAVYTDYIALVTEGIRKEFSETEITTLSKLLNKINTKIMFDEQ